MRPTHVLTHLGKKGVELFYFCSKKSTSSEFIRSKILSETKTTRP